MVPHFQLDPPEEIFDQKGLKKVNSQPYKIPQRCALSSPPEPSLTLSLHLSIRWNSYFSTIIVHFPVAQRTIWSSSCHFWPLILKTQSLHPLLFISPLSFNAFTWWKFSKRLQTFQFLATLWWFGEMSFKMTWRKLPLTLRDIFLPWMSSFKGKLHTFFFQIILERIKLCPEEIIPEWCLNKRFGLPVLGVSGECSSEIPSLLSCSLFSPFSENKLSVGFLT